MQPKISESITDCANGEETQNLEHEKNSLNDSGGVNVMEEPPDETGNTERDNAEEQSVDPVNGICDDKNKKKKKKKRKQEEQQQVLPASDSSGYQSDHKKSKKKKRKHCEVEESELTQLPQEPKAKKKRTEV